MTQRRPTKQTLLEASPWLPVEFDLADASAMKALEQGTATPEQQRRALHWIVHKACGLSDWPFRPGENDRDTNIALGRQFPAHQIVKLIKADLSKMRRDKNADEHEPQS